MRVLAPSLVLLAAGLAAQTQTIVSPAGTATVEGSSSNGYPFGSIIPRRYMQIHSDIGGALRTISKLSFRMNGGAATNYTGTAALDTELWMGHSVAWNKASLTYAANWLTPPSKVVARKTLTWGPQGRNGMPAPFLNMDIPLDTPFVYVGVAQSLAWEAALHSYTSSGSSYMAEMDADGGSVTTGASTITGIGCLASTNTFNTMEHDTLAYDYGGTLLLGWAVSYGPPNAPAVLSLGATNPNLPIPGLCSNLLTDLVATLPLGTTDRHGSLVREQTPWLLLNNAYANAVMTTQVHAIDLGRANQILVCNSDGRSTTIPAPNPTKSVKVTRIWNDFGGTTATRGAVTSTTFYYGLVTQFTY